MSGRTPRQPIAPATLAALSVEVEELLKVEELELALEHLAEFSAWTITDEPRADLREARRR